jgi:hypothetical protein
MTISTTTQTHPHQNEFDGFTYLGFFAWKFYMEKPCKVCGVPAEGYAVVIGRGDEYLLRLCSICGRVANEYMSTHGVSRRKISTEHRRRILADDGSVALVAARFGVSESLVRTYRKEVRGEPLVKPIPDETKDAIRRASGGTTEISIRFGVSRRSVLRIRGGNK